MTAPANIPEAKLRISLEKGATVTGLMLEFGYSRPTILKQLRKCGLAVLDKGPKKGGKYGNWTVIRRVKKHPKLIHFLCRCACGTVRAVVKGNLVKLRSRSCGCDKYPTGHRSKMFRGVGQLGAGYWSSIRRHAKAKNRKVGISIEDAWELFEAQAGRCALSGLAISFADKTASLDRIDSTKGYVSRNVQWLHKDINRLKNNYTQEQFVLMCRLVTEHAS